jgi:hypothetical protein
MAEDQVAIQELESRLQRGWELIDEAERQDDERAVTRYTRRWLQLLADYESLAGSSGTEQSVDSET